MAIQDNYTKDEWETLRNTPAMAGFALMAASPSGPFDMLRETSAMAKGMAGFFESTKSTNPLVSTLEDEIQHMEKDDRKDFNADLKAATRGKTSLQMHDDALAAVKAAAAILAEKASAEDTSAYRQWLLAICQKVAEAGKEGFMGSGPKVIISETEQALIGEISSSLGG